MKLSALTICLICCNTFLFAQKSYTIKGLVTDTVANYKLVNTAITLLNKKDSTLVKYTRANPEGNFSISNLHQGKFILLITYPGYADYVEDFILDSINPSRDFGKLNLLLKSTLLEGVIIKGNASAITIKGDTTEFNAGSYNIQPNSKVEDLLRQLPGIQVGRDGKITAHGQTVRKVLVDGEEFFGDDPTLVTRNLRGDMIDKVQLYDKKSDQAAFTGIDDGIKTKTINLTLKEDKKNGIFGNVYAGIGTKSFYSGSAVANIFRRKEKFAAYGTISNTGDKGIGTMMAAGAHDGIMEYSAPTGGIPLNKNGGLHYENKWDDKYGINSNYNLNSLRIESAGNDLTINNLPGGTTRNESNRKSESFAFGQKLDGILTITPDPNSTLKVSINGTLKNNHSTDNYTASGQREDNSFLNKSVRDLSNNGENKAFNASAFWSKKLRKKGRTYSVNLMQSFDQGNSYGYLNSSNEFFNRNNQRDSIVKIDQYKTNHSINSTINTNITYTEPISEPLSLILNYGIDIKNSRSDKKSFNKDVSGNYNDLDREYSNNFKLDELINAAGAIFNYKINQKATLNFGTRIRNVQFKQFDFYSNSTLKRNFINWNPQITYTYGSPRMAGFVVNYNGNTTQPSIEQVQPLKTNTDPLQVVLGNPNLRPSFKSNISMSYNMYKVIIGQSLRINGDFGFTSSPITNNTFTDPIGKTTIQAINLTSKTPVNFNLNISHDRKIKSFNVNIDANVQGNYDYSVSNNSLNTIRTFNYSFGPGIRMNNEKYYFSLNIRPSYDISSTTLQTKTTSSSWGINGDVRFFVNLPGKIALTSDGTYQYTGKSQTFNQSLNQLILNAAIAKKFLKDQSFNLELKVNDLLNQNSGFSRSVVNNTINQSSYNTIRRYFMFSLTWDFNKMNGG